MYVIRYLSKALTHKLHFRPFGFGTYSEDKGHVLQFVYKGYPVIVKVTAAKTQNYLFLQCELSIGNNPGYVEDRVVKFVYSVGFSAIGLMDRMV